jgi:hypothetical protein
MLDSLVPVQGLFQLFAGLMGHLVLDVAQLVGQRVELPERQFRLVDDGIGLVEAGILREITDLHPARDGDIAGIRLDLSDERLEQGGFPAPVGPDEPDALAAVDVQAQPVEHDPVAESLLDV